VPAGAVLNAKDLWEDPQLNARGFFVEARAGDGEAFPMPGTPIVVDGQRRTEWRAAPVLGEHNHSVLQTILGLSRDEVAALEAEGVLCGGVGAMG
jgi:crotonobetainyl-CoA:carnitine CoA-transferase CaiB-like acyl-CoA transferase